MSTNPAKSDLDGDDNNRGSGSFFRATASTSSGAPRQGPSGSKSRTINISSDDDESQVVAEPQETSSVKVRNVSRERPPPPTNTPESKRLRISDEDDDEDEEDEVHVFAEREDAIHMDTDTFHVDEQEREVMEMDSGDADEDQNVENTEMEGAPIPKPRRSSMDGVSTTVQSSSRRHRPMMMDPDGDHPFPSRTPSSFVVDDAIASTSTAAMAPPLSRMMEDSPDLHRRFPTFQSGGRSQASHSGAHRESVQPSDAARFHVDVNENKGQQDALKDSHGKQKMEWARKLFLLGTELVFPGFTAAVGDGKSQIPAYMGVRVKSSCIMQALLYADSLFFILWIISFLSTCDILVTVLKQLHGYLAMCLTGLFILVNIIRLRFGLKGNENDEVQYLALFWMTTVIVQIPLFTFIFLTDLFCPVLLAFTVVMDGTMLVFILFESVIGFMHFRSVLRDELNVIRIARRRKEGSQSRVNVIRPPLEEVSGDPVAGPKMDSARSSAASARHNLDLNEGGDSSSEHDSEFEHNQESMDFRMHIRRLSETQEQQQQQIEQLGGDDDSDSNSSEQVTSTSDAIRHRPIRAH